jgi:predicted AlkP superfamily pyrophosphatase or phosphodiesterase
MQQKLIVISADALTYEDVEYLKTLPNYQKYLAGGCRVKKVRSIYPTNTYPCHTTMRTGVWPDKHGIVSNFEFCPQMQVPPWQRNYASTKWDEDIFKAAKRAGLTTASVFWPVTGNHPYVDYLITECWPTKGAEDLREVYGGFGSTDEVLDIMESQLIDGQWPGAHPDVEEYEIRCAREIILRYQPDLLMVHPGNIDAYRHTHGVFNEHVTRGIEETDRLIGLLMSAVEEAGLLDCTNLVLTSDHGFLDVERFISPNVLFAEEGLIELNENKKLKEWKAYCLSGGNSALVYLKNPDDTETYNKTWEILQKLVSDEKYGVTRVYTAEEALKEEHLSGDFSFVLETADKVCVGLHLRAPYMRIPDKTDPGYAHGNHGHHPERGIQPVFSAKGPAFQENVTLETANLIDHAPTYAKVLGVDLRGVDGRVIEEFIR